MFFHHEAVVCICGQRENASEIRINALADGSSKLLPANHFVRAIDYYVCSQRF